MGYDAVIVAGGAAARLGGVDKPALLVGGRTLLEHVVDAVADADQVIVVGPRRPVQRPIRWCREEPPGGGPMAAVAAGLPMTSAEVVVLLAADLPWIAPVVPRLCAAIASHPDAEAAVLVTEGRRNFLAAAWRRTSLERTLAAGGDPANAAMRSLYADARIIEVVDDADAGRDCDTWADIAEARARAETKELT